jgi:hypothetical protein
MALEAKRLALSLALAGTFLAAACMSACSSSASRGSPGLSDASAAPDGDSGAPEGDSGNGGVPDGGTTSPPDGGSDGGISLCGSQAAPDPFSVSIAGTWNFTPQDGGTTQIQVPGGGWGKQGFNTPSGTYETQINVPDSGAPQSTLIEFGAVNFQATLSVDGTAVGTNMTSFTPSVFDITKFVTPGTQHTVSVLVLGREALQITETINGQPRAVDLIPTAAPWSSNVAQGIFRSAELEVYPEVYLSDVFVRTSVTNDTLTYDVSVTNTGTNDQPLTLSGELGSWNCSPFTYPAIPQTPITATAGTTTVTTIGPIPWGLGTTSYWWPNVPYQEGYQAQLHNLRVDVSVGGAVKHEKIVRFGFREIDQTRADSMHVYYYLNGVHVRFHGDNMQGADYDSIDNNGAGDAYDTLPGFLPPSAQNAGWPQAIADYQKLNYNFIRVHQELAAPYMLDTADELGMMLMGETAIRGSNGNEDFLLGQTNMVNHAKAMVLRDRNHPAIVRWSQSNEPDLGINDSDMFEQALFNAVNTLDGTRPVSIDGPTNTYGITAPNFASFGHYFNGLGNYSEAVNQTPNYPYGQGEFIWPADNSRQGLAWFATGTMEMRVQDASDARPYALLSGWPGVIPGVTRASMTIEQGGNPLFGWDNLPEPWASPIIQRLQQGFGPVLVADQAYWEANKMSDSNGDWPASVPTLSTGATTQRTLLVFNDTFSGTAVTVIWEFHAGSATGAIASSGTLNVDVPLGSMATTTINATAPSSGSMGYLVLRAQKSGTTLFEEDDEAFNLN